LSISDSTFSKNLKEKAIILTNYNNNEEFKFEYQKVSFPVYFINQIQLPHEKFNRSYFFSLDEHFYCTGSFFLKKGNHSTKSVV